MSSSIKNVILIGAGGNLGPYILYSFASDSRFKVSILARQSSESTFPSHHKVYHIGDDYPEVELLEAFKDQDAVISTIATTNVPLQRKIIDTAIKAGVKRFVPSEFGSDSLNEDARALVPPYFATKKEVVDYLKTKEKEGLTWTSFVPGVFFDL